MTAFYVGTQTQFTHAETDANGGALPPQLGQWSSTNTAVATVDPSGLVSWLAVGETDIVFLVSGRRKFGVYHAPVLAPLVDTLLATPEAVTLNPGEVQLVAITALDSASDPIADFAVDSIASDDEDIATIVRLEGPDRAFLVVGKSIGTCTVTVESGTASLEIEATVEAELSLADADARYRRLGIVIQDSEIAKTPVVPLGDVSGAVPIAWTRATRARSMRIVGNTVATLADLAVGEFAFLDVSQDGVGGRTFHLVLDAGLPPQEWDEGDEPEQSPGGNRRDSYMAYNEGARVVCSRTWKNIPTL